MTFWKTLLFSLLYIIPKILYTQNLVQNGGFEQHNRLDCLSCTMFPDKFAAFIPPWLHLHGIQPFICDCSLKGDQAAKGFQICDFNKVMPFRGCNMLEMAYMPTCWNFDHSRRGVPTYVATKLSAPLEVGNIYEVSFWVFILPAPDSAYARKIGFNVFPKAIRNPNGSIIEGPDEFTLDTVIYNQWYQVKWLVRPVCNLQFLLLGVFKGHTAPPINLKGYTNRFYIDEVSVKQVETKDITAKIITPYCRYKYEQPASIVEDVAGVTCYFASGDSTLSPEDQVLLDSFAARIKRSPIAAFVITGHTDSAGTSITNTQLSTARINTTLTYLETRHHLPPHKFIKIAWSASRPISSNRTEQGRKLNRRVEIAVTDTPLDLVIYRNALLYVFAGEKKEAYKLLNIWLHITKDKHKILLLFDPRIAPLRVGPVWNNLVKKIKASYQIYKQPALAFALDSLGTEDQKCRVLKHYIENLNAYVAETDSLETKWDVHFLDITDSRCSISDEQHIQALLKWIGPDNWPCISDVGERPAKNVFLIMAHTSDTTIIAHYLPLLRNRCVAGEAEWLYYVTLYDRLQVDKGLPQRYGTQYKVQADETASPVLFPLEDPVKVNQWRAAFGLPALEDLH